MSSQKALSSYFGKKSLPIYASASISLIKACSLCNCSQQQKRCSYICFYPSVNQDTVLIFLLSTQSHHYPKDWMRSFWEKKKKKKNSDYLVIHLMSIGFEITLCCLSFCHCFLCICIHLIRWHQLEFYSLQLSLLPCPYIHATTRISSRTKHRK